MKFNHEASRTLIIFVLFVVKKGDPSWCFRQI